MRADLSNHLIHLVKGDSWRDGLQVLECIISERRLKGGTGMIKGGYRCVCFSEAPLEVVAQQILVGDSSPTRYLPFGVVVPKSWLFAQGGRPVIYQPESEFLDLPASIRWRHVRYEPNSEPPIDFTWEREWRVRCDELPLDRDSCHFLFPSAEWYHEFMDRWHTVQSYQVQHLETILGADAWHYYEDFTWARDALDHYLPSA